MLPPQGYVTIRVAHRARAQRVPLEEVVIRAGALSARLHALWKLCGPTTKWGKKAPDLADVLVLEDDAGQILDAQAWITSGAHLVVYRRPAYSTWPGFVTHLEPKGDTWFVQQ